MLEKHIKEFEPFNEQEEKDKEVILEFIRKFDDYLTRENKIGHFTATAWTVNETLDKVLMAYHNIYDSWAWLGGHADGESDLAAVSLREVTEETGVIDVKLPLGNQIFSLEVLATPHHIKNGVFVNGHLHMNVTYLVIANELESLKISENENSDVKWIDFVDVEDANKEVQAAPIYKKLIRKVNDIKNKK